MRAKARRSPSIGAGTPPGPARSRTFFLEHAEPSYISHSELQFGRAASPDLWADGLHGLIREQAVRAASPPATPGPPAGLRLALAREGEVLAGMAFISFALDAPAPFATLERPPRGAGKPESRRRARDRRLGHADLPGSRRPAPVPGERCGQPSGPFVLRRPWLHPDIDRHDAGPLGSSGRPACPAGTGWIGMGLSIGRAGASWTARTRRHTRSLWVLAPSTWRGPSDRGRSPASR